MTTRLVATAWWCLLLQLVPTAMAMMLVPSQVTRRTGVAAPRARPRPRMTLEAALEAMDAEEASSSEGEAGIGESDAVQQDADAVSSGGSDDDQAASATAAGTKSKPTPAASKRRRRGKGKGKGPSHKINSNKKGSHQMIGARPNCEWRSGSCVRRSSLEPPTPTPDHPSLR